ncbi:MAG: PA14 domain-containing protein [Chloroflexi bacterium]|nr:PA14 domain-containing protein [Chloroflexota bacterium]
MMNLLKTNDTKLLRRHGIQTPLWVLFAAMVLIMAGCVQPNSTGQEQAPTSATAPAGPVIAVAPLNGQPGVSISVASAGWQPKEVIYINLESIQAGKTVASTVGVATADNDGRVAVSFILPPDVALSDSPDITVVAYSSTTGEKTSTPFTVGEVAATATITGTTTATLTQTATATPVPATSTAIPVTVAAPTATPTNLAHVQLEGLNLRAGPGTNYLIVANLGLGTELAVIGQSANGYWLNVRLPGGGEGWLARPYTDFKGAAPVVGPPPAPTYAPGATATPTPLYTSTPANTPSTFNNWRGEYFNNRSLISNPVLVRDDPSVDFDWGNGAPAANLPADNFAVRWTRGQYFDAGTYRFHLLVDDGAYLFVDDNLLINEWHDGSVRETTADLYLGQGTHNLRVEYYENTGDARIRVWWERIDSSSSDSYPDWKGEYWDNRHLDGDPELTRNDGDINFNWGNDSPDDRISDDNFSVRWTRTVDFRSGLYRLTARADDGIRVWVDGDRVIDEWRDNNYDDTYTVELNLDGDTDLRVEYYEHNGGARVRFRWDRIGSEATTTPSSPANPNTDVNPTSGTAGSHVFVTGGGFPANTAVHVYLGAEVSASSASAAPKSYANGTTDNRGFYRIEFDLPTTWPDGKPIEPGQLVVMVATDNFTVQASDVFQVLAPKPTVASQPYTNVEPSRGGGNTPVTIYGGGFPANTRVGVYLAEVAAAALTDSGPKRYVSTTTDANGNYSMRWTMPSEWANGDTIKDGKVVVVVATDNFSLQASATFDYFTKPPISRSMPAWGSLANRLARIIRNCMPRPRRIATAIIVCLLRCQRPGPTGARSLPIN